ncbi:MAG: hypothetical protein M1828_004734 [Chrysothrix sp. TS-e1954]|nr:MAG: hypothetical protein M1828_004734 [Chrysothrix sp. TS-e1954]
MSNLNIVTLPRITATALATLLRDKPKSVAVVDVRDSDYIGGHIAGSRHVPSSTLDYAVPELVRTLSDSKTVVFHCMLSQQRGPSAALRYARERERLLGDENGRCLAEGEEGDAQRVCVLTGGFGAWKEKFAEDKDLTEGYNKELWEDDFD